MPNSNHTELPIKTKVYLRLVFLCAMIFLIYASTTIHISYSHNQMSSLTRNYYDASNFMSTYLAADEALKSIVETPNIIDISYYESTCRDAVSTMYEKLDSIQANPSITSQRCSILYRTIRATLDSYQSLTDDFFSLWQSGNHSEASRLYANTIYTCGGYLQQYCSKLLEEELYLGQDISASISKKNAYFFMIHSGICILIGIISFSIYRVILNILKPVYTMIDVSNEITAGNMNTSDAVYDSNDEMGRLVYAFNQMKNSTQRLIVILKEKKEAEAQLAEARIHRAEQEKQLQEAVVLQLRSQIMPHFLFNTLNIIGRTARIENAPEAERLIFALSHLFRSSLRSTVEYEAPLLDEINMAKDYGVIQQARFGERMRLDFRIGDDVNPEDIMVPSFFLQPLIENAIIHGLENRVAGGIVRVRIRRSDEKLIITISDNGQGMSKERLAEIMRGNESNDRHFSAIGVNNVKKRILMSHRDNQFTICSKLNRGTSVKIVLYVFGTKGEIAQ